MISAPHYPNGLPTVATVVLLKLKGQVGFNYPRIDQNFSCQPETSEKSRGFFKILNYLRGCVIEHQKNLVMAEKWAA